jgi:hypothetical protein
MTLVIAAVLAASALLISLTASGRLTTALAQDRAAAQPLAAPSGTQLPKPDPAFTGKIGG